MGNHHPRLSEQLAEWGWSPAATPIDPFEFTPLFERISQTYEALEQELVEARDETKRVRKSAPPAVGYVGRMSHEVRTPLSGILGMIEQLASTPLNVEQQESLAVARRSAQSLLAIFNDMVDFSEVQNGTLEIERIPFDVHRAVEQVGEILEPAAREKDVRLIVRYDPDSPRNIVADPGRLRQVLRGLTAHSISRSREGHVLVDVAVAEGDPSKLVVSIENTGPGIQPEKLERIFDDYLSGDVSTRHWAGTGLSLTLCRRLVELMGGKIGAESQLGVGSRFWFEVPVGLSFESTKLPRAESLADLRVMVVDSSATGRRLLEDQITALGARCETLGSAAPVLTRLRSGVEEGDPFQVLVLSTHLQEMYAETLGDLVKGDRDLRGTDLVLLTSLGKQGDAAYLSEVGFAGYLVKPIEAAELEDTLRLVRGARLSGRDVDLVTRHTLYDLRESNSGEPASPSYRGHVLLAEPNGADRRLARAFLESLGYRVDAVSSGMDAVHAHEENHYDAIVLHGSSGAVDAQRATDAIRARELSQGTSIPILALVPDLLEGERVSLGESPGFDDIIAKPFREEDFERVLKKWTGEKTTAFFSPPRAND